MRNDISQKNCYEEFQTFFVILIILVKMDGRDEILANFQVASGIEDLSVAIEILESTDWSFEVALDLVTSQGNNPQQHQLERRVNIIDFVVHYKGRIINIQVADDEEIVVLKQRIENETSVNTEDQILDGLQPSKGPLNYIADDQKISELYLKTLNRIMLENRKDPTRNPCSSSTQGAYAPHSSDFKLLITVRKEGINGEETHTIHFRPGQTVHRVKVDISDVTDIPVSRQNWEGWPEHVYDNLTLEKSGIPREHKLCVSSIPK